MVTKIRVTNKKLFDEKVIDVHTDCMRYLRGTIGIETVDDETKIITGEHGELDYEKEYGFVLTYEDEIQE